MTISVFRKVLKSHSVVERKILSVKVTICKSPFFDKCFVFSPHISLLQHGESSSGKIARRTSFGGDALLRRDSDLPVGRGTVYFLFVAVSILVFRWNNCYHDPGIRL